MAFGNKQTEEGVFSFCFAGNWPVIKSILLFCIIPVAVVMEVFKAVPSLSEYLFVARKSKLMSSIFPNIALSLVLKIMGIFDDFEGAFIELVP